MIESRFILWRTLGMVSLLLGLTGFGYLFWVYAVWAQTLPSFQGSSIYSVTSEVPVGERTGFGELLDVETVGLLNDIDDSREIKIDRVLAQNEPTDKSGKPLGDNTGLVRLSIPRLSIENILVQLDVNGANESIYDTVLTRAVAHLVNSAYPGELGNTFIFGHSMLPIFAGNSYESIFTNLPKVKEGDIVKIDYSGQRFTYQISQTGVVDPSDVFVMNQPKTKKMLTLMTCIPPGFENQRYITVGELIEIEKI